MTKIAILSSHNGSGFEALYNSAQILNIQIPLVISNNQNANVLQKAKNYNIDTFTVNANTSDNPDEQIEKLLLQYGCSYVFLSGYMKKISANLTEKFNFINSHPALLPKYGGKGMYGRYIHEAVIKNNEKYSGVTIHEVNEHFDEGKIIFQEKFALDENEDIDSLEQKIKELEALAIVEGFKICLK
jgi:phosphoribosylglycinamide formyltransferase 1